MYAELWDYLLGPWTQGGLARLRLTFVKVGKGIFFKLWYFLFKVSAAYGQVKLVCCEGMMDVVECLLLQYTSRTLLSLGA